jgi:hypothetical protein
MTYSVYQHWDPLRVCVVGRSYPPEFYSWIKISHVRKLFEKIAVETEEDYQAIIKKLESFGVKVMRPNLPVVPFVAGKYVQPPMTPRDYTVMVGERFYQGYRFEHGVGIKGICTEYEDIFNHIELQGNRIFESYNINGSMLARIGKDLYLGTHSYNHDTALIKQQMDQEFPDYRNHVVNTGGHSDGTYCPVCPGLIISLKDVPTYADTFPDWEVVYLPGQSWAAVKPFMDLKHKNAGKWWIPGFEQDQAVVDTVETWLGHWTGYVEETVFDVNMLIIDPKNVMVFNYNKQVFDALDRFGITPHIVPFRHRYFWDGGIHCVTSDLHREGTLQDFFPNRQ